MLLAAALDSGAPLEELVDAAALLHGRPLDVVALDPAVELGLVDIAGTELRFRHPLVRSAVRQAAPPAQLLAMYAALAEVVADPERKLWHRAMSAAGYDEEVAAALEDHARAARRRGAVTVAAAALERAAALTADPHGRATGSCAPPSSPTTWASSTSSAVCSSRPSRSRSVRSRRPVSPGCGR